MIPVVVFEGFVFVHVYIVASRGAIVQKKVKKISQAADDADPEEEPAGSSSHGSEDEVVVLAFHAPIVAHFPESARVYPKKLIVVTPWYIRT